MVGSLVVRFVKLEQAILAEVDRRTNLHNPQSSNVDNGILAKPRPNLLQRRIIMRVESRTILQQRSGSEERDVDIVKKKVSTNLNDETKYFDQEQNENSSDQYKFYRVHQGDNYCTKI